MSTDPARIQSSGVPSRTRAKSPPQDCLGLLKTMSSPPAHTHTRGPLRETSATPRSFLQSLSGLGTQQSGNGSSQLQKFMDFCPFEHRGVEQHNVSLPGLFAYGEPHVPGAGTNRAGGHITPEKGRGKRMTVLDPLMSLRHRPRHVIPFASS